jgi:hypothetical protein
MKRLWAVRDADRAREGSRAACEDEGESRRGAGEDAIRSGDFVVLTADPLADIRNTRTIESVWIDGRRLD